MLALPAVGCDPRRHPRRTVMRWLRGPGPELLDDLPELRHRRTAHRRSLSPLPAAPSTRRGPRRQHRTDPPRTAGPARRAGHRRSARHDHELAHPARGQIGARRPRHRTTPAHPHHPRRSTAQQGGGASAQRPGGHRGLARPGRATRPAPAMGHSDPHRAHRPTGPGVAAPLRGLARAAADPATQPRRRDHLRTARHGPPAAAWRHLSPRLATHPRAHPFQLPPARPRRLADQQRRQSPGRSRPLRALGDLPTHQPRPALRRHPMDRPGPPAGPGTTLAPGQTAAARRRSRHRRPRRRAAGAALRPTTRRDQPTHPRRHRHQTATPSSSASALSPSCCPNPSPPSSAT